MTLVMGSCRSQKAALGKLAPATQANISDLRRPLYYDLVKLSNGAFYGELEKIRLIPLFNLSIECLKVELQEKSPTFYRLDENQKTRWRLKDDFSREKVLELTTCKLHRSVRELFHTLQIEYWLNFFRLKPINEEELIFKNRLGGLLAHFVFFRRRESYKEFQKYHIA